MDLGPAHSTAQAFARIVILLILIPGFFVALGTGFWLGAKWFGGFKYYNRIAGLPLFVCFMLYLAAAAALAQFW